LLWALAATAVAACGSDVLTDKPAGGDGSDVDLKCYDDCIAKGVSAADCTAYCSGAEDDDGKGTSKGGASGSGGAAGTAGDGTGAGEIDPEAEKTCIQCWYDEAQVNGTCATEAEACEESLACTQLQWCPFICEQPNCVEECNEVIPMGVEPLTALVQCMACDGGPCASECQASVMLAYCK